MPSRYFYFYVLYHVAGQIKSIKDNIRIRWKTEKMIHEPRVRQVTWGAFTEIVFLFVEVSILSGYTLSRPSNQGYFKLFSRNELTHNPTTLRTDKYGGFHLHIKFYATLVTSSFGRHDPYVQFGPFGHCAL
jgi:hypothetical protein